MRVDQHKACRNTEGGLLLPHYGHLTMNSVTTLMPPHNTEGGDCRYPRSVARLTMHSVIVLMPSSHNTEGGLLLTMLTLTLTLNSVVQHCAGHGNLWAQAWVKGWLLRQQLHLR